MERTVAIKKLGKMLGKNFGYRVDPKAPNKDERDEAREKLKAAVVGRDALRQKKEARMKELLADAEYQGLLVEHAAAAKQCLTLLGTLHHYRFTGRRDRGWHVL